MSLKFGTSGLRGLSEDLEGAPSAIYANAFAEHLLASGLARKGDTILIGRDFRPSSPAIAAICTGALRRAGFKPADCGTLPTPALALYGLKIKAAGLMITGSHIPADRNGIKFYRPDGEIGKEDETAISALALHADLSGNEPEPDTADDISAAVQTYYYERYVRLLAPDALTGLSIGVYQHSTVARTLLAELLRHYGAKVVELGWSDTFIPVDTEAVSKDTTDRLEEWAHNHGLDAIVSADGDGDRPLVADEKGAPLRGDLLGLISAEFLNARTVMTPVTSNSGLEAKGLFDVVRTRVGSPFVIAGMMEALADDRQGVMGFEANGGVLTASSFVVNGQTLDPLPTRDCFLPVVAVLWRLKEAKQPLSALAAAYRLPIALSDRLENFPVERSAALMTWLRADQAHISRFLEAFGQSNGINMLDGLRITLTDGRVLHLRPSGNAPEMRCYVEAKTGEEAESLMNKGLSAIRDWIPR